MAYKPTPPDQIKPLPTWIGIREGQGSADGPPKPGEPPPVHGPWYLRWFFKRLPD
jgi:hypothetical protein